MVSKIKHMKTYKLVFLVSVLFITACHSNRVYEEHIKNFKNYRWDKTNVIEFNPEITDSIHKHQIYLALRHVYGFQFEKMLVQLTTITPSGQIIKTPYSLNLTDENKEYKSECAGDYCDLEVLIEKDVIFSEIGTYTFQVAHLMPINPVPNVMEFGMIIETAESE
jgi:gliding motility-associated lipoprotein GldH